MKKVKWLTFFTMACLLIVFFQLNVFADSTQCLEKNVTVCGYTYCYYCGVGTENGSIRAYATVISPTKVNYPTGYYGINARLYNESGTLISGDNWIYNPDSYTYGRTVYSNSTSTSGTYYSKAQMKFYNGNGYNTYTCNTSPYMQRDIGVPMEEYKINENGQTYGSDFYAETIDEMPDLIRVLGINNREGYVYRTDLHWEPENLEDVLEYISLGNISRSIPVYLEDGITVIDSFEIGE